jgi:hypothetical protein
MIQINLISPPPAIQFPLWYVRHFFVTAASVQSFSRHTLLSYIDPCIDIRFGVCPFMDHRTKFVQFIKYLTRSQCIHQYTTTGPLFSQAHQLARIETTGLTTRFPVVVLFTVLRFYLRIRDSTPSHTFPQD